MDRADGAPVEISALGHDLFDWDTFVRRAPDGTPYHLSAWTHSVERVFGQRAHYLVARRGRDIEGALPLFETRGLAGDRALISIPYAVYGGVCAVSDDARRALVEAAADLGRRVGARYVELRQRHDLGLQLPTKTLYSTFTRPLSASDEDNALAIPRRQRRMIRQGVKHGLQAEVRREHLPAFYGIYAQSWRNLGTPVLPRAFMRSLAEAFGKECDLMTVWRGDRMVAGVLSLYYDDHVLPYYAGALPDALRYAVNDFMYWELMCHAVRRGCRVFDFGRSRQGTGAYHFKRHWGFEPEPLAYQYILLHGGRMPDVSPSNARFRLSIALWKRLPLTVANRLGPILARRLP